MKHLFREFFWIDFRFPPSFAAYRYRRQMTLGQDDFGNAIPISSRNRSLKEEDRVKQEACTICGHVRDKQCQNP